MNSMHHSTEKLQGTFNRTKIGLVLLLEQMKLRAKLDGDPMELRGLLHKA